RGVAEDAGVGAGPGVEEPERDGVLGHADRRAVAGQRRRPVGEWSPAAAGGRAGRRAGTGRRPAGRRDRPCRAGRWRPAAGTIRPRCRRVLTTEPGGGPRRGRENGRAGRGRFGVGGGGRAGVAARRQGRSGRQGGGHTGPGSGLTVMADPAGAGGGGEDEEDEEGRGPEVV